MKLQNFDFRIWSNADSKYLPLFEKTEQGTFLLLLGKDFSGNSALCEYSINAQGIRAFEDFDADCEIELGTCAKDVNGKRIFNNDIIKKGNSIYTALHDGAGGTLVVRCSNGMTTEISATNARLIEIIGNIHEGEK